MSELLGRTAYDRAGRKIGRIVDVLARPDAEGRLRVYGAVVTPGRRGRLLGYEREGIQGPWLIERLAGWLHSGITEVEWRNVRLDPPTTGAPGRR